MSDAHGHWLHENFEHTGSAFGLRIKRKLEEVQSASETRSQPLGSAPLSCISDLKHI